jgi:hypothetical protein
LICAVLLARDPLRWLLAFAWKRALGPTLGNGIDEAWVIPTRLDFPP